MAPPLCRSASLDQTSRRPCNAALMRSVSSCHTCTDRAQNSTSPVVDAQQIPNSGNLKDCLVDAKAQLDTFVEKYSKSWDLGDTDVVLKYSDAEKRLPCMASQLGRCELESLLSVKNILDNMKCSIPYTLRPEHNSKDLTTYLEKAERATENAVILCQNWKSNFFFKKSEQKDLLSSNDIMSAALVLQHYFADMMNKI